MKLALPFLLLVLGMVIAAAPPAENEPIDMEERSPDTVELLSLPATNDEDDKGLAKDTVEERDSQYLIDNDPRLSCFNHCLVGSLRSCASGTCNKRAYPNSQFQEKGWAEMLTTITLEKMCEYQKYRHPGKSPQCKDL